MAIKHWLKWLPVLTLQCLGFGILYLYLLIIKHWEFNNMCIKLLQLIPFMMLLLYELSFMRTALAQVPDVSIRYRAFNADFIAPGLLLSYEIYTRTSTNEPRYCSTCGILQPDRAYHCQSCGQCVLRMDHHCYWLNNCIHFGNYKFFILTQWYGALACLSMAISCGLLLVKMNFPKVDLVGVLDFYIIMPALVIFFVALCSLSAYYFRLILANQTLMERSVGIYTELGKRDDKLFDLGWKSNFTEIFGDYSLLMFLPVFTSKGTGEVFKLPNKPGQLQLDEFTSVAD